MLIIMPFWGRLVTLWLFERQGRKDIWLLVKRYFDALHNKRGGWLLCETILFKFPIFQMTLLLVSKQISVGNESANISRSPRLKGRRYDPFFFSFALVLPLEAQFWRWNTSCRLNNSDEHPSSTAFGLWRHAALRDNALIKVTMRECENVTDVIKQLYVLSSPNPHQYKRQDS